MFFFLRDHMKIQKSENVDEAFRLTIKRQTSDLFGEKTLALTLTGANLNSFEHPSVSFEHP